MRISTLHGCYIFLALLVLLAPKSAVAQLNISSGQTAAVLAQKLAGPGVTIINPVLVCNQTAAGTFTAVSSNLGLDSGVVLTTGTAASIGGVASILASTNNGTLGDPQLTSLAGAATHDACRLEFDIIPKDDSLKFEYIFGSEEYNNATCGPYNDAFSFFISGPGIVGQENMALVPGTSIPVAVNSINGGVPGSQGNISNCTSMGPGSPFTTYYIDNTGGSTVTYKGFTIVLRAVHSVQPCSTYHLKMTIADAGNALYDSGVFIKAGSIRTDVCTIKATGSAGAMPPVVVWNCGIATVRIKRNSRRPQAQTVKYLIAGDAIRGIDYNPIPDSVTIPANDTSVQFNINALKPIIGGRKTLWLYLLDPGYCSQKPEVIDSTYIVLYDVPSVHIETPDTGICPNASLILNAIGSTGLSVHWLPFDGLTGSDSLQHKAMPKLNTTYIIAADIPGSGCAAVQDSVRVNILSGPAADAGVDQSLCAGKELILKAGSLSASFSYSWTGPNGYSTTGSSINIPNVQSMNSGGYILHVSAPDSSCTGLDTIMISVRPAGAGPAVTTPVELCVGEAIHPLIASGIGLIWYTEARGGVGDSTAPEPSTNTISRHQYYVSRVIEGCESLRSIIEVSVFPCCAGALSIPSAFTPNGDGQNDHFGILNGVSGAGIDFSIYNRWGELVYRGLGHEKWDGTLHGVPAPTGTYYYLVHMDCRNGTEQVRKGEVLLIR